MNLLIRVGALFSGIICFTACGRYAPPISPELTSPQSVEVVEVAEVSVGYNSVVSNSSVSNSAGSNSVVSKKGLAIRWLAPERDVRGEPLKELWGYQVYRVLGGGPAVSKGAATVKTEPVQFEKIGEVKDATVAKLKDLRSKARDEGQVERKVKLSREDRLVTFVDRGYKVGSPQSYKIVPLNSSYVMPDVDKIIQVKSGTGEAGSTGVSFEMVANPEFTGIEEDGGAGFDDEVMEE